MMTGAYAEEMHDHQRNKQEYQSNDEIKPPGLFSRIGTSPIGGILNPAKGFVYRKAHRHQ